MDLGLDMDRVQSARSSEMRLARSTDCETLAGMPLSTLLYCVLTESLFMGPVPEMRRESGV
jgi:hypothetical protein